MQLSELANETELTMKTEGSRFAIQAKFHRYLPALDFYQFSFYIYDKYVPVLLPAASAKKYTYNPKESHA